MDSKHLFGKRHSLRQRGPMRFLHRFSDSGLHTTLMVAVVLLASFALYQAFNFGVAVWQLDPVLVQGAPQSQAPAR